MSTSIEWSLYHKQYQHLLSALPPTPSSSLQPKQKLLHQLANLRTNIWQQTCIKKQPPNFQQTSNKIHKICSSYSSSIDTFTIHIFELSMKAFLFQIETDIDLNMKQDMERKFIQEIGKLPNSWDNAGLYFEVSLIQLFVKKNTRIKNIEQRRELDILSDMIQKLSKKQPKTTPLCRRLYMIVLHLQLHNSNLFSTDLSSHTIQYLQIAINALQSSTSSQTLISTDTVVVLLYNCLKTMLGFNELSQPLIQKLDTLTQIFGIQKRPKTYSIYILEMFFIIKLVIFKKKQQSDEDQPILQKLTEFAQKFSVFLNCNMDEIVVSLHQLTRNIIRHKVASLSTIIGIKLGITRFSKDFLQIMHDSPFNNDVQTIKLCFQLFEFRQFQKIVNLLQTVLSVPATKSLKMRQVLIAMCSILIGLYLQNRQEGLLYCKLNHQNFLSQKLQKSIANQVLKQQTFLQHVGFGYYNIACHQKYRQNRQIYLTKALQNFLDSYKINPQNYLLNYCISKIYLQLYSYQNAYKHAMQACKSHRGSWAPFCLLACIYICEKKFQKSYLLIEELLRKYQQVPILHYIRAYLQINKILLDIQHDQQIEAAKMLGDEYYVMHFDRLLKHKSINVVIQYCQNYYQLSLNHEITEPDQNYFVPANINAEATEAQKYLIQIVNLLDYIGQYNMMENILKVLPQNSIETLYYKAILHEKRKQTKEARAEYQNILKLDHTHCQSLIKLALLPQNQSVDMYKESRLLLETAGKFVNHSQYCLAKGIIESKLGNYDVGNQYLLATRELGWCEVLPDLFYYY